MHQRPPLVVLLALLIYLFPPATLASDRTFTIVNSCSETLWTAITNFGEHQTYTGSHGFEQKSGNSTAITIPSPWNGRIWPRRKCEFDDAGSGKCVTGDCDGLLECKDGTIGTVNVGEFNLDSWEGNDFWDQSCVPGWTVPMLIEPQGDGCESVSCTRDVNAACPDDKMKVKDDEGNTLECIAACFAGINATEPSMNCCSGKYNDLDACVSDQVDYYNRSARTLTAYDSRPGYPTVDFACPSSGHPGYKIEYCPGGSSTSGREAAATVAFEREGTTSESGGLTKVSSEAKSSSLTTNSPTSSSEPSSTPSTVKSETPPTDPTFSPASRLGFAVALLVAVFLLIAYLLLRRSHGRTRPASPLKSSRSLSSIEDDSTSDGETGEEGEGRARKENSLEVCFRWHSPHAGLPGSSGGARKRM
ncbi:hypothetical protein JCM11251_000173 [Rhodosporidiobolus azoricus]